MVSALRGRAVVALLLAVAPSAFAEGPRLVVQRVETSRERWPRARIYVLVTNTQGAPVVGLTKDVFRIYENGGTASAEANHVDTLEKSGSGAAVALVVQASGSVLLILEDIKRSIGGFVAAGGEKDQFAIVDYSDAPEVISGFTAEKADVISKLAKLQSLGRGFSLYDGIEAALSLYQESKMAGGSALPSARAILVLADGRDNGSSADAERVISEAIKKRIPIHAIGHSEMGDDKLADLRLLSLRTGGYYAPAPTADDLSKAFNRLREQVGRQYVIDFDSDLPSDGKNHRLDVVVEMGEGATPLRGTITFATPEVSHRFKYIILAFVALLMVGLVLGVYLVRRPKPPPPRECPVCRRIQIAEWDACLFCLKSARAKMLVQKGQSAGKVFPLISGTVQIGSAPENAIRLGDAGVSGQHCLVRIEDVKFEIVDSDSTNGVLVNGRKTSRRLLRNGDVITLGQAELKFETSLTFASDDRE